jgi:hypothetical protein
MIQVQHIPEDFPGSWEEFSEEAKDSLLSGELWSDTEWKTIEQAKKSYPTLKFREVTIHNE